MTYSNKLILRMNEKTDIQTINSSHLYLKISKFITNDAKTKS